MRSCACGLLPGVRVYGDEGAGSGRFRGPAAILFSPLVWSCQYKSEKFRDIWANRRIVPSLKMTLR